MKARRTSAKAIPLRARMDSQIGAIDDVPGRSLKQGACQFQPTQAGSS